jgi:hypothetical protein
MRRNLVVGAALAGVVAVVAAVVAVVLLPSLGLPLLIVLFVVAVLGVIAAVLLVVFATVFPLFGPETPDPSDLTAAEGAGRRALARVVTVRPTGAQVNGQWVYDVDLVVAARDIRHYRTTGRVRLHRREGLLRGGEIVTVVRIRPDAPEVVIVSGPRTTPQDSVVPTEAPGWTGGPVLE